MKKLKTLVAVAALGVSGASIAAGVGVVDSVKVAENSTYLKTQQQTARQTLQPIVVKLEQLHKELNTLQETLAKKADAKMEQQFQTKLAEFNKLQQDFQSRTQQLAQDTKESFERKVGQAAEQLRVEQKLDLIVERGAVLSLDKKHDLTDKMIQKVNAIK